MKLFIFSSGKKGLDLEPLQLVSRRSTFSKESQASVIHFIIEPFDPSHLHPHQLLWLLLVCPEGDFRCFYICYQPFEPAASSSFIFCLCCTIYYQRETAVILHCSLSVAHSDTPSIM